MKDFTALAAEIREQIAKLPAESRHEFSSLFTEVAKVAERYEQHDLLYKHARSTGLAAEQTLLESVRQDGIESVENWLHSTAASRAEEGDLEDLISLLNYGRWRERPQGVRLTNHEARILLEILEGKRKLPRRASEKNMRAMAAAHYSFLLELDDTPTEAAIKSTEALYGLKRSSIFAARKQYPLVGDAPDAETRSALMAAFKADAARS